MPGSAITFQVPASSENRPQVGDELTVPTAGGQEWFCIGRIESAGLVRDPLDGDRIEYVLRLGGGLLAVRYDDGNSYRLGVGAEPTVYGRVLTPTELTPLGYVLWACGCGVRVAVSERANGVQVGRTLDEVHPLSDHCLSSGGWSTPRVDPAGPDRTRLGTCEGPAHAGLPPHHPGEACSFWRPSSTV